MTHLIRCRGALAEIAQTFAAEPHGNPVWRPYLARRYGAGGDSGRHGTSAFHLTWALPESCYADARRSSRRSTFFAREMHPDGRGAIMAPDCLTRCLIVMEACAYPDHTSEPVTRSWAGL